MVPRAALVYGLSPANDLRSEGCHYLLPATRPEHNKVTDTIRRKPFFHEEITLPTLMTMWAFAITDSGDTCLNPERPGFEHVLL